LLPNGLAPSRTGKKTAFRFRPGYRQLVRPKEAKTVSDDFSDITVRAAVQISRCAGRNELSPVVPGDNSDAATVLLNATERSLFFAF